MSTFWRYGYDRALLLLIYVMVLSPQTMAANLANQQNIQVIKDKVTQTIESRMRDSGIEHYQIEIQTLDNRLKLAACEQAIRVKAAPGSNSPVGRQSIEVRCTGKKPWKIYLQAHVYAKIDVPVLKHALPTGVRLSASDIETKRIQLNNSHQPIVRHSNQLIGKRTRRHLNADTPILVSQIVAPHLIKRGQQVNLEYELDGLKVSMTGKSNQDGAEGDWIKVVNINSGKVIEGRVNANGNVSIRN